MLNGKNNLPVTHVFVDYESWFWSLYFKFGETPDVKETIHRIKERGSLGEIYFFGDFTKEEISTEHYKLRAVTNNIIDCSDPRKSKNYTDFIMLDHIYRTILQRPEVQQYVLITGDGHFTSVVAYLTTFQDKTVGVYAVEGSFSSQLKNSATWFEEITPKCRQLNFDKVLSTLYWNYKNDFWSSFRRTVDSCASYYNVDRAKIQAALSKLIDENYIRQEVKSLDDGREVKILLTDWEMLEKKGIWSRPDQ